MNDSMLMMVGIIANAAVTWGIVKTQLAWLRRDVDELLQLRTMLAAKAMAV